MCKVSLKESCKSHGAPVQGLYALCSTLIREVRVAGSINSTETKFEKFRKKNIRDILFYLSLPHVINSDIFISPPYPLEPYVINGHPRRRYCTLFGIIKDTSE